MIQLINIRKSFNGNQVLKGVNLHIPKGKVTVILGPSGCGKSVLMKHMIGLLVPDEGRVQVDGVDIHRLDDARLNKFRKKFGMLFQSAALFDSLTVGENVAFPLVEHASFSKRAIDDRVQECLALVGLQNIVHKMPSELSGGMRKRVGLARAIALQPEIILYDEPTTGLDPLMTDAINHLIIDTQKKLSVTSVVISHDIEGTFEVAHKVAVLHEGVIVAEGSSRDITGSSHPFVQKFLSKRS
ncbi:MAG: ABC transporter ATP-binding protein [Deltaproteobacteria bacterium RIFCSPLOWO2_02_FULL_50_16]|nr:MAG: ABC transporter ATP-binding protein [Deltaproteobacteria bacterium GWA2_50_8]OGQ26629.1 MAG: ABC transporter ATP-binding protein [Deltaproteobacteria bacterium RIFCSPHIGHO2_02_FULL_50_15]OGQ57745.1 MAG: ABC transporter ATP-binding protein [Deltaproteobacteria bacterium RIFCSPLOWO2_02_FULL_50_16]OGQ68794.1 MAG: ABC transporter ATP-binding protein [Deltaproteobacteria bacterium RIFCSPLOWO2_12_FULL_50_11]